jgi:transposase
MTCRDSYEVRAALGGQALPAALCEEIAELDEHLDRLVADAAPELTALPGIGTDHAATLLTVAGDNPQRLKSEASFASLCGVSPIEASSGKVIRHRLNTRRW